MWVMSKCLAGSQDGAAWTPQLSSLGVMIFSAGAPSGSSPAGCSSVTLLADVLDSRDNVYMDIVIEPQQNGITSGTIEVGVKVECKCGRVGNQNSYCMENVADFEFPWAWGPLDDAAVQVVDPLTMGDIVTGPDDPQPIGDVIFLVTIPPGVASVTFTTCEDALFGGGPGGLYVPDPTWTDQVSGDPPNYATQLWLLTSEAEAAVQNLTCVHGGMDMSQLPILAYSGSTPGTASPNSCGTISLPLTPGGVVAGSYRLIASPSGYDWYSSFRVKGYRRCACGFGGPDCSLPVAPTAVLGTLSGALSGSTIVSKTAVPAPAATNLVRWTASPGGANLFTDLAAGVSFGGRSGLTSVFLLNASVAAGQQLAALEVHTCGARTRDPVFGVTRSALVLLKAGIAACSLALGSTPLDWRAANAVLGASDGLKASGRVGACASDLTPSRIVVASPPPGPFAIAVTGAGSFGGDFSLFWYAQCECGRVGAACDVALTAASQTPTAGVSLFSAPFAGALSLSASAAAGPGAPRS